MNPPSDGDDIAAVTPLRRREARLVAVPTVRDPLPAETFRVGHRRAWRAAAATLAPPAGPGRAHDRLADLPLSARNAQVSPGGDHHDRVRVRGSRDRRRPECWVASRHRPPPVHALFARAPCVIERKVISPGGASSKPPSPTRSPSPRSAHRPAPPDELRRAPQRTRTQLRAHLNHDPRRGRDAHDDSHPGSIKARFQLGRIIDSGPERRHQRTEPACGPDRFGRRVRARVLR